MKNIIERQRDILSIITSLDISPTMYKNAVEKYKAITQFLSDCGIEAEMYPQGSFAFGTVVRPYVKSPNASYDLDFICQVGGNRDDYSPSELRSSIEKALSSSNTYGGKLEVCDECLTVEYADVNGIGFSIDIVPATDETSETKKQLTKKSRHPNLIDTAIAIPKHNGERNYTWLTNNPKGFRAWFDEINEPFMASTRIEYRKNLYESNKTIFASVEEIPHELERSALQRVIQLLKYHRDVYYAGIKNGDSLKPISALINAVVTQISAKHNPNCSIFELLQFVLGELDIYAQQQRLALSEFTNRYGNRTVFTRQDDKWYIANPANPADNLADQWNSNKEIPDCFFRWVRVANTDLIESLQNDDEMQFRAAMENGFSKSLVESVLGQKYCVKPSPKPISPQAAAKPYQCR